MTQTKQYIWQWPSWHMLAEQQPKENWQTLFKRASFVPIQAVEEVLAMTFVGTSFQVKPVKSCKESRNIYDKMGYYQGRIDSSGKIFNMRGYYVGEIK